MQYTFEIYKKDKRCIKPKGNAEKGEKLVRKFDTDLFNDLVSAEKFAVEEFKNPDIRVSIHETMVERTNIISGKNFMERYDTPYYCSPSSETYWSS